MAWSKTPFAGTMDERTSPRPVVFSSVPGHQIGSSEDEAMTRIRGKGVAAALILAGSELAFLLLAQSATAQDRLQAGTPRTAVLKPASSPYIDAHVHIDQHDPEGAVQLLLRAMDGLNGAKAFIQ